MKLSHFDKALFDLNYYLKFNSNNKDVYYYISNIYFDMAEYEKAYEFALKATDAGYILDNKYKLQLKEKTGKILR